MDEIGELSRASVKTRSRPRFFTADENPLWICSSPTFNVDTVKISPRLNSQTIGSTLIQINQCARRGTARDVVCLINQQILIGQISIKTLLANALNGAWYRDFFDGDCEKAVDICVFLQCNFPDQFTADSIADRLIEHARLGCWWMLDFLFKVWGSTFSNKSDFFLARALIHDEALFRSDAVYRAQCVDGFLHLVKKLPDWAIQRDLLPRIRMVFGYQTFPLLQCVADHLQQKINAVCAERNGATSRARLRIAGK